ncbi:Gldg family protein [Pedobacter hiemivivus]|uniref:ABC transporter n=1 Tax=Pedobacter hiemivivus TaxID=2530454 RepID=A0A4R0MV70_9SPHI|nr:Gldg family protein [Pedobacter hiemivivus]TCC91059.1 ABC transporter [Pedobacter hiemivivus]
MKLIFKIAKNELRNLFYSPVAWFLSITFLVLCAVFYTSGIGPWAKSQDVSVMNDPNFKGYGVSLTESIFVNGEGVFNIVLQNLFLFIPLLTMGLISREINNGTIKLLYSSPVKTRTIIFGKYVAVMIYNMILLSMLGIFIVAGLFDIQSADYGLLLSAALGFYLLVCAYTAIGLFMSSLTTYQIVSAIGSFMLIFILTRIGVLWQKYDFVRDLTYFLSISGRTHKMLKGLITSNDVIYFLLIVYIFLGFTWIRLQGAREVRPWFVKAGRYMAVMITALLIGYATSRPGVIGYWDTTAGKTNTLHENTQKIITELGDEPLEVTLYTNLLGVGEYSGFPQSRNNYLWALWEPYLRFKHNIKFNYEYYYDVADEDSTIFRRFPGKSLKEIAALVAYASDVNISMFKTPPEMRKIIDLKPEAYRLVMQLKYKGRTTFLRIFTDNDFWPDESQVGAAFKRLTQPKMPVIMYVTGNLERNIHKKGEREYSFHSLDKEQRRSLINQGFDLDTVALDYQDIPTDISTLVLADPKTMLSATAISKLQEYINKGGNMLILGEPGKQQMLNPLLQQIGIQLMPGILVELSKHETPEKIIPYITLSGADLAPDDYLLNLKKSKGQDSLRVGFPGAIPIHIIDSSKFKMATLMTTVPGKSWLKAGRLVTDSVAPIFSPQEGDTRENSFPVMLGLTRKVNNREQRIVVCGDADFLSNYRGGGAFMSMAFFSWMNYNQFPNYTPKPKPADDRFSTTYARANMMRIIFVWILPAILLILGTTILIRRKRQ